MRRSTRLAVTAGILLLGSGLAAYPFVSNHLYEKRQQEVILAYDEEIDHTAEETLDSEWKRVKEYNEMLVMSDVILTDPFEPEAFSMRNEQDYNACLNLAGDGVMGHLEIPVLNLNLSIYHGTEASVLERGVGHLEMTSLPAGGEGTHTVLSAHAGLPEKKLFTDLELMKEGDVFFIRVLDEVLAYQVNQIKVVEPHNTDDLRIESGKDYATLLTCTPYGVNSHRLLVRGERIPYEEAEAVSTEEKRGSSPWMKQYFYGVLAGFGILFAILFLYLALQRRRKRHES